MAWPGMEFYFRPSGKKPKCSHCKRCEPKEEKLEDLDESIDNDDIITDAFILDII